MNNLFWYATNLQKNFKKSSSMCAHLKGWVMEIGSQGKDSECVSGLVCRPQRLRCEGPGRRSPGSMWSLKFTPQ